MSLLTAIQEFEQRAENRAELHSDRAKAMDYYLGRPMGNEVEGRSKVVSHDVSDSINWVLPGLMRIFTSGDEVVNFTPTGQEDIAAAQQETDYVNYVITQKNDWYSTAYVWFLDALIQRNGYVKAAWDEKINVDKETYKGLTADGLAYILRDPEVEILSAEEYPYQGPPGQQMQQPGQPPFPMNPMAQAMQPAMQPPPMLYNVTVQKSRTYGCAKFCNIAPERTVTDPLHTKISVMDCQFFEHWEYKSLSDLTAEGFDVPDSISADISAGANADIEEQARDRAGEFWRVDVEEGDPAMRKYRTRECWIRYDDDGDDIAELHHCIVIGSTILLDEEVEFIPVACLTPRIMPHRHIGISVADDTMDIQDIKTALQRGFLDNVYFSVNGRHGVDKDKVNLDDMLTSRPAGIVRTTGAPAQSIMPLVHPANFQGVLEGINYFDTVREGRTGSGKFSSQLSPDVLAKLPSGIAINQVMQQQQALVELVARTFSETGVKDLFRMIHAITLKNATQPEIIRLRNEWVPVDPRGWKTRTDMIVSVGLGTGNKDQQMAHLGNIMDMQGKLLPLGITKPEHIHHAFGKFVQAAGFKDAESFSADPKQAGPMPAPPPPPPDPVKMQELQIKGFDAQTNRMKAVGELTIKKQELTADSAHQHIDRKVETALELARMAATQKQNISVDANGGKYDELKQAHAEAGQRHDEGIQALAGYVAGALSAIDQKITALSGPRRKVAGRGKDGKISHVDEFPLQ